MIYTKNSLEEILTPLLQELADGLGVECVWKQGENMQVMTALPLRHRTHLMPFCAMVKAFCADDSGRCRRNDEREIVGRAAKDKQYFVHQCHAGAWELVVPRFSGDRYVGTLLMGPFRQAGEETAYAVCREAFQALPLLTRRRQAAMAAMANRLLTPVLERVLEEFGHEGDSRIAEAVSWLRRNFRKKIEISELCRRVALSESHFYHLFRRETGVSCGGYLTILRLEEARRLLSGTRLPIAEIARICCLIDQSRMTLLFRRRYGMTPAKFRSRALVD